MLRLMLLRHAKSSWVDGEADDRDRDLTERGRCAAKAMGRFLEKKGLAPELVLCSPARRARLTWQLAADEIKSAPKFKIEEALYDFGNGGRLLDTVARQEGTAKSVLLVGHNPSIERLAGRLISDTKDAAIARLKDKYPTGALLVVDFDCQDWRAVGSATGMPVMFVRPKDIE